MESLISSKTSPLENLVNGFPVFRSIFNNWNLLLRMRTLVYFVFLLLVLTAYSISEPMILMENCKNALDDDGDGLVDLNDPDCTCAIAEPTSLIPNPSFEDQECCPENRSSLHCATTWIQASEATTDYLHTCGWFGWENLPVPTPIPDGDACIGFRNGRFGNETNANWKEYTGACLTEPLRAGNTYRFEFYLGFTQPANSPPINVVFFGSANCENLPFGIGDDRHGCPLNGEGWMELDRTSGSGSNSWVKKHFTVTPDQDIYAIAIGPDCFEQSYENNPYYFLDDLVLADIKEFEFVISANTHPCASDFSMSLPRHDSTIYQWFRDGIALPGETDTILHTDEGGLYQVLVEKTSGAEPCKITKGYFHSIPVPATPITQYVCDGESYNFNGRQISEQGVYIDTFKTKDNCDSLVILTAQMVYDPGKDLEIKIFDGESYSIGGRNFSEPGREQVILTSSTGCDSTVNLEISFYEVFIPNAISPNGDGINDQFMIFGSQELISIKSLDIFDRWGSKIYSVSDQPPNQDIPFTPSQYANAPFVYFAKLIMDDDQAHIVSGNLTIIR